MKQSAAWAALAGAAIGIAAAMPARAQDTPGPNGTSPGQIATPMASDIVPDVRARTMGGPPGRRFTPTEIARSFYEADVNHDGSLTRAEAQRLAIMPYDFDQIDRDHDGAISRFEYEDAFQ